MGGVRVGSGCATGPPSKACLPGSAIARAVSEAWGQPSVSSGTQTALSLAPALLDLPVQPTTEVMGFGHSSASAAQHLPFRFYDHTRRGSCDPAVQRSVFASVDKVPGKPPAVTPGVASSAPRQSALCWRNGRVCWSTLANGFLAQQ